MAHDHGHGHCGSSSIFHGIEQSQISRNQTRVEESKKKIVDLTHQIEKAEMAKTDVTMKADPGDWTQAYQFWNKWEDVDELVQEQVEEKSRLQNFIEENNFTGHCSDHTEERKIFELPEVEKLQYCERHRLLGNYLYSEGLLPKAAEQYQLALSYYEYCFPDSDSDQKKLDILRHSCLCNISLCFLKMGYLREAEERATQAISESHQSRGLLDMQDESDRLLISKAYYRRAQARRSLDEYETALEDIEHVLKLSPDDTQAIAEKNLIEKLISDYEKASQRMATVMFGTSTPDRSSQGVVSSENTFAEEISCLSFDMPLEPNVLLYKL